MQSKKGAAFIKLPSASFAVVTGADMCLSRNRDFPDIVEIPTLESGKCEEYRLELWIFEKALS